MTMRILHVVGGMNRGGTETWLMNVLRHIDRQRFQMDFLVHTTEPCAYDDEVRALGSRIIPCLHPSRPWSYARNFKRVLREYGPYDVVHSHVHHYSGYVLRLAQQAGVPVRIAHSHSDTSLVEARASAPRRAYLALMKRWIGSHATVGLACSGPAAAALFGQSWPQDSRYRVLHCGIDLKQFNPAGSPRDVRAELGIPADAFVVGHVGRFAKPKNHAFLIDIAVEVVKRDSSVRFLLIGDGPLRGVIENKVRQLRLESHVIFTGSRADVPRLMLGAMDLFLFPSTHEGLPLALVEAQASGLPCVCSDLVSDEAILARHLVRRMSLDRTPAAWAETVLRMRDACPRPGLQPEELLSLAESSFSITTSAATLLGIYSKGFEAQSSDPRLNAASQV